MNPKTLSCVHSMIILMVLQIALMAHSPQVNAETDLTGFINAVGGYATERPTLGYEADTATFTRDSSIGIQISHDISPKITATGQLVAKGEDDFETEAAWAYLTYRFSDSARFRMGRFRAPFFMYSDFLNVGYAQHWIRAPEEVYSLQFDSVNGADLNYNLSLGRLDSKIQMYFGSSQDTFAFTRQDVAFDVRLREQMGVIGTVNYGWLTARLSFHQATHMTIENFSELALPSPLNNIAGLRDAIRAFDAFYDLGANADFLLEHLDVRNIAVEFSEAAIRAQWAHFFLLGEGTLMTFNDSPLAKQRRHLVSVGTNWSDVTLYLIYARANDEPVDLTSSLPNIAEAQNLRRVLQQLTQSLSLESETATLGLRYDLDAGAAFKVEVSENTIPQRNQSNLIRFGFQLVF
jgi:hypothetical protein